MKLQLRFPSLVASHHLPVWCAPVVPKQAPRFGLSHPNYHRTNPDGTSVRSTIDSQNLSHHGNPIEFA
jgi:hypothetical protein